VEHRHRLIAGPGRHDAGAELAGIGPSGQDQAECRRQGCEQHQRPHQEHAIETLDRGEHHFGFIAEMVTFNDIGSEISYNGCFAA